MGKKNLVRFLALLFLAGLTVCAYGSGMNEEREGNGKSLIEDSEGNLTALDTESSLFPGGGVRILVNKEERFFHFQITDKKGNDTKEYYRFYPDEEILERLSYVAMMGTQFIYKLDYQNNKMLEVINVDGENVIDSARKMGRLEKPETEMIETGGMLQDYVRQTYGMSIEDAVQ
jgi:hypothetical protein